VRKRVADALILLSQKEDNKSFQVLREDLARIVGTAKESVIRMLTEFKNDGYIDITEGTIIILDLKKLSNLPS
jgi:CRP-like cAMP-binding protein